MVAIADDEPPSIDELAVYQKEGRAWVATGEDDRPVAFILARVVDFNAHIDQVSVHPDHARQGIGAALIETVCPSRLPGCRSRCRREGGPVRGLPRVMSSPEPPTTASFPSLARTMSFLPGHTGRRCQRLRSGARTSGSPRRCRPVHYGCGHGD